MAVMSPLDVAVGKAVPYLATGLLLSPLLLLVPANANRFTVSVVHLSALVLLGLALAMAVAPLLERNWFDGLDWPENRKRLAGGIALVVIVTGVVGLVTLASSAALRLQPSLQFLQLLSALDIAWAAGAVLIGGYRLWSRRTARVAGLTVGVACVLSIWNYLRVVGFTADGGWLLDGGQLMRLVLPFDMLAAAIASGVLFAGARRQS